MFHEDRQREIDWQTRLDDDRRRFRAPPLGDLPPTPPLRVPPAPPASEAEIEAHERHLNLIAGREIAQQMKNEGKLK